MRKFEMQVFGELVMTRLSPSSEALTRARFREKGVVLPDVEVESDCDLRVLEREVTVRVVNEGKIWNYIFKPGFIWDLATVPRPLRGVVDNDRLEVMVPAMVHDVDYALHKRPWKIANRVFCRGIRYYGGSRMLAFLAFAAVSLPVAKRNYRKNDPETHWFNGFVEVVDVKGNVIHGRYQNGFAM